MQIPKPTDTDKEFFRSVLPDDPEIEIKPMFGIFGAFVHGNMFAGLFGPTWGCGSMTPGERSWRRWTAAARSGRAGGRWAAT